MCFVIFFFNDTATTEIYTYGHTLSLHDALPIYALKEMARGADALVQVQQALALAEKMGSRSQQGLVLRNMARTEIELGDLDAAARAIDRGLALAGSDGDTTARAQFLGISATLAQRRGHVERARRLIDRALADVDIATPTPSYRPLPEPPSQIYKTAGHAPP